jgi:hypothetical protein
MNRNSGVIWWIEGGVGREPPLFSSKVPSQSRKTEPICRDQSFLRDLVQRSCVSPWGFTPSSLSERTGADAHQRWATPRTHMDSGLSGWLRLVSLR